MLREATRWLQEGLEGGSMFSYGHRLSLLVIFQWPRSGWSVVRGHMVTEVVIILKSVVQFEILELRG